MTALVQSAKGKTTSIGGNPTVAKPWPVATTLGNLLIATVQFSGGSNVTITPPAGWSAIPQANNVTNCGVQTFYILNSASRSGSESFGISPTSYGELEIAEYSGLGASAMLQSSQNNYGNSTTPTSAAIATVQANSLLIVSSGAFAPGTFSAQASPTNSFVIEQQDQNGTGVTLDGALLDRIVTSTGTYSTQTTIGSSAAWAVQIAEFNSGGGGGASYAFSGPSSGFLGVASTNFTVTGSGLSGSVIVTPADDLTGMFTPTSVTLTPGSPVQTFVYQPHEVGTKSISVTNNGGLTDPSPVSYVVSGYPDYRVSYALGYGAQATHDADWMRDPSNMDGVFNSSVGPASVSVTLDYGVPVNVGEMAGTVGYANALTDQWEWSSDGTTWNAYAVTGANTPPAGSGTFANFYQVWTPTIPATAQFLRYSIKDTPSGAFIGQSGVINLYGSPGNTPVLGASGGPGVNAAPGNLPAGGWSTVPVAYDHTITLQLNNSFFGADAGSPDNYKIVQVGPTGSIDGAPLSYLQNFGSDPYDGPTSGGFYSTNNTAQYPADANGRDGLAFDLRYYYDFRWDEYWRGQSSVRLGFFLKNWVEYFHEPNGGPLVSAYTTLANGRSFQWPTAVRTTFFVKRFAQGAYFYQVVQTIDFYIGHYTIANYTLPRIGTGRTVTIDTVQFLNSTSPFGDPAGNPYDFYSGFTLCPTYGAPAGGFAVGEWSVYVNASILDNDAHTGPLATGPFYDVTGADESTMTVSVPTNGGPSPPFGTALAVAYVYVRVPGNDIFETFGGGIYAMSGTFVITEDLDTGGPVTGGPGAGVRQAADAFNNHIAFAWISGNAATGALKAAIIRNAVLGNGAMAGWESIQTIESANASDVGLTYLPSGRLYLCYDLSGAKKYRTNDGFGRDGVWSATGTPSPAVSRHSSTGRGQGQAFRFRALTSTIAGDIEFSQCRDNIGALWTSPVTAISGVAIGPWCGGVYILDGYGVLYTKQSNSHIYWADTVDPDAWTGVGTDTGKTGQVIGATRTSAGVIVGAVWDSVGKKTRSLRSRDVGDTWEIDGSDIAAVPSLDSPPCLVSIEHLAFLVWQVNDQPAFAMSTDGGVTWA